MHLLCGAHFGDLDTRNVASCTVNACYFICSAPFLSLSQGFHRHAGAESLSDKERDLYSNLVQELKSDGTLSSEISDLFTYMSMTPSQDLRCSPAWRVCKTCIMSISSSLDRGMSSALQIVALQHRALHSQIRSF